MAKSMNKIQWGRKMKGNYKSPHLETSFMLVTQVSGFELVVFSLVIGKVDSTLFCLNKNQMYRNYVNI